MQSGYGKGMYCCTFDQEHAELPACPWAKLTCHSVCDIDALRYGTNFDYPRVVVTPDNLRADRHPDLHGPLTAFNLDTLINTRQIRDGAMVFVPANNNVLLQWDGTKYLHTGAYRLLTPDQVIAYDEGYMDESIQVDYVMAILWEIRNAYEKRER